MKVSVKMPANLAAMQQELKAMRAAGAPPIEIKAKRRKFNRAVSKWLNS